MAIPLYITMNAKGWMVVSLWVHSILGQFDVSLPVTAYSGGLESRISLENKQVYVDIDLSEKYLQICCKPNRDIFQIIHSFLRNPFFQINEYTCPGGEQGEESSEVTLPSIGIIQMNHTLIQYPDCSKGRLGLAKQSTFLNYLPVNDHTIKIQINQKEGPSTTRVLVSFGQNTAQIDGAWNFTSDHQQLWDLQAKSIDLGYLGLDPTPKIIFTSLGQAIKIPNPYYEKVMAYFPSNQTCQVRDQKLICLCESGVPVFFPKFIINLPNGQKLAITPKLYMRIDSNICTLLLEPSLDDYWHFNVAFFEDTVFYLDRNRNKITIVAKQQIHNESSELIHLPIQLILNCAVILLLCIFASLVLIEIVKRISSLPENRETNVRQYLIQQNLIDS